MLLLLFHILLHKMPVLRDVSTDLFLVLALRLSHIHLNAQWSEQVGALMPWCSPRKVPLQESHFLFKMGITKILMCALLNTDKKLFSQAAVTVYTDVRRALGCDASGGALKCETTWAEFISCAHWLMTVKWTYSADAHELMTLQPAKPGCSQRADLVSFLKILSKWEYFCHLTKIVLPVTSVCASCFTLGQTAAVDTQTVLLARAGKEQDKPNL